MRAEKTRSSGCIETSKGIPKCVTGDQVQVGGRTISLETSQRKTSSPRQNIQEAASGLNRGTLEKAAVGLIDVAANILKSGVHIGLKSGAKSSQAFKQRAESVVTTATRRVSRTLRKGGKVIRKSIKKL